MQKLNTCLFVLLAILVGTLVLSGCAKNNLVPVTGTVTLDGKPVEKATVNVNPVAGGEGAAVGETDASGKFTLRVLNGGTTGAIPGDYLVTVKKIESVDTGRTEPDLYDPTKRMPVLDSKNLLPEKYNDQEKSGLKVTIVAGKNPPIELKLTSK